MPGPPPQVGTRVRVRLQSEFWISAGWHAGTVVRIDPYSTHRSFYWVELDAPVTPALGAPTRLVSVFNPSNIEVE